MGKENGKGGMKKENKRKGKKKRGKKRKREILVKKNQYEGKKDSIHETQEKKEWSQKNENSHVQTVLGK